MPKFLLRFFSWNTRRAKFTYHHNFFSLIANLRLFHRIERILLIISFCLEPYSIDGVLATPDWSVVRHRFVVLEMPVDTLVCVAITAALRRTLVP